MDLKHSDSFFLIYFFLSCSSYRCQWNQGIRNHNGETFNDEKYSEYSSFS